MIQEVKVKTALHCIRGSGLPFSWDLNIYRGCSHGCKYCFARYSHKYLNSGRFFGDLFVKTNIAEVLRKELPVVNPSSKTINIGGVTDSYQSIEGKYQLMRQILPIMIKYKNPIVLSTKSNLILRDLDLIEELAKVADVGIALTITTTDEKIREIIEPNTTPITERFEAIKQLKKVGVRVGVHVMPILPYLTDSEKNLDSIFAKSKEAGADYVLLGTLNLRTATRYYFLEFLKNEIPELYPKYLALYKKSGVSKHYKKQLYEMTKRLKKKYHFHGDYSSNTARKKKVAEKNARLIDFF